jgi:Asp/Glu/hydantoin racemase
MTLRARIATAEGRLAILRPGLREIVIRGGLDRGVASIATIDGEPLARAEGETSEAFRARAREAAIAAGAKVLVLGGLPAWPADRDDEGAA